MFEIVAPKFHTLSHLKRAVASGKLYFLNVSKSKNEVMINRGNALTILLVLFAQPIGPEMYSPNTVQRSLRGGALFCWHWFFQYFYVQVFS